MKKGVFDVIFIIVSAGVLLLINQYGYMEKYMAFSLIPILIAYYLGKFSERRFASKPNTKSDKIN